MRSVFLLLSSAFFSLPSPTREGESDAFIFSLLLPLEPEDLWSNFSFALFYLSFSLGAPTREN